MMRALTTAFQFWNLKAEGVPLTLIEEPCIGFEQSRFTTQLMHRAFKDFDADWVFPIDADEFVELPQSATLADILPAHGDSALNIPWSNLAWCDADDRSEELNPVVRLKRRMPSLHTMRKVIAPAAAGRHEAAVALLRGGACRTGLFACAKCKCARR